MALSNRGTIALASLAACFDYALWHWFFRPVGGGLDVVGYPIGRDFLPMWAAPQLAFTRGVAVLTDIHAFSEALSDLLGRPGLFGAWSYPPPALLLLMPFSVLPFAWSLALWTVVGWFGSLRTSLLVRRTRAETGKPTGRGTALLLLALSPAIWLSTETGQNGAVLAALLTGGLALLPRSPAWAGLLFGLMTIKPHLGIALAVALVAFRAWRAIVAGLLTALSLVLAATLAFGLAAWQDYEAISVSYSARILAASHGGQKLLLVSITSALAQAGWSFDRALAAQSVVAILVLTTLFLAARRTTDPLRRLALIAAATPLVSPYIWTYDLVALGAALALRLVDDVGRCPRWILGLGYLSPALSMLLEIYPGVATAPITLAVVFAALSWEALRDPETPLPASPSIPPRISAATASSPAPPPRAPDSEAPSGVLMAV